jgi:N-acetylneuraminic acid mutarotase
MLMVKPPTCFGNWNFKNTTMPLKLILIMLSSAFLVTVSCKKTDTNCSNCDPGTNGPISRAGNDQFLSLPVNFALLDGSSSTSAGQAIKEFNWKKINGPGSYTIENPNSAKTYVRDLEAGIYYFQLAVTDMAGSTGKDTVMVMINPTANANSCSTRSNKYAKLVPFGNLSIARFNVIGASAGSKMVFAGGWTPGAHSSRVDIYDTISKSWSTAELTMAERDGMAVATIGNKILFAGGGNNDWIDVTSRVDIYDATTNSWSIAELSQARNYPAAVTLQNKVYIAGGGYWGPLTQGSSTNYHIGSTTIDIYNNETNTWTTSKLSEGRFELSATAIDNKIYFAGGLNNIFTASSKIDIYDAATGNWSYSNMNEPRAGHLGVFVGDKILWAGGASTSYGSGYNLADNVEIRNTLTGATANECFLPKAQFQSVKINNQIIFFTGISIDQASQFDVYDISSEQWTTVVLPFNLKGSAIVAANNNIYIAGGSLDLVYTNQVWKLEF